MMRSLLFVPGDRPERFEKAAATGADALILDLEDAVALSAKSAARAAVRSYLRDAKRGPSLFVRINPLGSAHAHEDLIALLDARPDGIVLPKAEGRASVEALAALLGHRVICGCFPGPAERRTFWLSKPEGGKQP